MARNRHLDEGERRALGGHLQVRVRDDDVDGRGGVERRIASLLDRMSSREVQQLRGSSPPPGLRLPLEIRTTIRDVTLGRQDER